MPVFASIRVIFRKLKILSHLVLSLRFENARSALLGDFWKLTFTTPDPPLVPHHPYSHFFLLASRFGQLVIIYRKSFHNSTFSCLDPPQLCEENENIENVVSRK
jgi:hypothetical protein